MQTKLTLRMDDKLIEQMKIFAQRRGRSISQIVADYFALLNENQNINEKIPAQLPPIVSSLSGILKNSEIDENEYYQYLEEKYS